MKIKIIPSPLAHKKLRAIFYRGNTEHVVDFGARGMSDFTIHKDLKRKERFLTRFRRLIDQYKHEPTAPMTLSTWLLWNKPTLEASLRDYKKHFQLR